MELTPQLMIGFGSGLAIPLIRWLLQKPIGNLLASGEAQMQLEADLKAFKEQVALTYVDRAEFLRHITTSEAKADALHRRLDEVMGVLLSLKNKD